MRQQHQLLLQSNRRTPPTLTPTSTPFSISNPFLLSHSLSPNSTASSSSCTLMDSASLEPRMLSIPPRTNKRSAKRKRGKKKEEEGEFWNVLEFGGMTGKKKEERMIKKKRVRVRVWRIKKKGKKKEKRRRKCYHNIFTINFKG